MAWRRTEHSTVSIYLSSVFIQVPSVDTPAFRPERKRQPLPGRAGKADPPPRRIGVHPRAAWRQFRTMLEYKADWYGRNLVVVDRWYPSSKLCSACGALAEAMPLHVRSWGGGGGGRAPPPPPPPPRDVNAACNILAAGLAVTACGAGVRPQRESSRTGRSAVKQENPRATTGIPAL
ncbi:zinc ribbon domain-containing protein [Planosporangium sp. 12N6]|uniref:zinc ribbon domain-containing protein n=1 Tax=Planosporangium spinosum TaxID=3402278 RepID=UPI003CF3D882